MIYIGVDPGSRCTGIAGVDEDGKPLFVQAVAADSQEEMCRVLARRLYPAWLEDHGFLFVVESQQYRGARSKGNPAGLIALAHVAGAAYSALSGKTFCQGGTYEDPTHWKGSIPKLIHQRRTCSKLGWQSVQTTGKDPYLVPTPPKGIVVDHISKPQWRDVLDAVGLALWLRDSHTKQPIRSSN